MEINNDINQLIPACLLCLSSLKSPYVSTCNHIFCKECILKWLQQNFYCPVGCGVLFPNDVSTLESKSKQIGCEINNFLHFKCLNNKKGCDQVITKSTMDYHLTKECKFQQIQIDAKDKFQNTNENEPDKIKNIVVQQTELISNQMLSLIQYFDILRNYQLGLIETMQDHFNLIDVQIQISQQQENNQIKNQIEMLNKSKGEYFQRYQQIFYQLNNLPIEQLTNNIMNSKLQIQQQFMKQQNGKTQISNENQQQAENSYKNHGKLKERPISSNSTLVKQKLQNLMKQTISPSVPIIKTQNKKQYKQRINPTVENNSTSQILHTEPITQSININDYLQQQNESLQSEAKANFYNLTKKSSNGVSPQMNKTNQNQEADSSKQQQDYFQIKSKLLKQKILNINKKNEILSANSNQNLSSLSQKKYFQTDREENTITKQFTASELDKLKSAEQKLNQLNNVINISFNVNDNSCNEQSSNNKKPQQYSILKKQVEKENQMVHDITSSKGYLNVQQLSQFENINSKQQTPDTNQQKTIIREIMKMYYKNPNVPLFHIENYGNVNQLKFLISAEWWKQWCQYVNFSKNEDEQDSNLKNSLNLNSFQQQQPSFISNMSLLSQRTIELLENSLNINKIDQQQISIKENLLEHYDYEALPKEVYMQLKKWYNVDIEIIRTLKQDPLQSNKIYLDLYPGNYFINLKQI